MEDMILIWKCLKCGEIIPCDEGVCADPPERCPSCDAPKEELAQMEED